MHRLYALALSLLIALSASAARAQDRVPVLASFSILGDLVREVGGDRVAVSTLVPRGVDMHAYQPSPADVRRVAAAKLVVINGLGLEGWADRLVKSSGYRGARLVATQGLKALAGDGEHGPYDPHAWQDVANVRVYVTNIRDALKSVDSANHQIYDDRAADYLTRLDALQSEIESAYRDIPKPRRVVTSHEAFRYYGDAYGIAFLAPQGITEAAQPSAAKVAQLIRQIRRESIKAVFVETISSPRVIEQIARETGATVGGALYSDTLSAEGGPAATYLDMMRHNTGAIAAALRGNRN